MLPFKLHPTYCTRFHPISEHDSLHIEVPSSMTIHSKSSHINNKYLSFGPHDSKRKCHILTCLMGKIHYFSSRSCIELKSHNLDEQFSSNLIPKISFMFIKKKNLNNWRNLKGYVCIIHSNNLFQFICLILFEGI